MHFQLPHGLNVVIMFRVIVKLFIKSFDEKLKKNEEEKTTNHEI